MSPHAALSGLLAARSPAVYFDAKIGDSILTLPTVADFEAAFTAPITMIGPKVAFDLCFREVSPRHVEIPGFHPGGLPPYRPPDFDVLAAQIGPVDLFINTTVFGWPSDTGQALRRRLDPATSIGFTNDYEDYDVVVPKEACHTVDLLFKLAQLFDPAARADPYSQPVPLPLSVQQEARASRAAVPAAVKVLVVHADTDLSEKRWPVTRFIDLLDRFLARHDNFVAWVVGMGHEELNVGHERDRVMPARAAVGSVDGLGGRGGPVPGNRLVHAARRRSGAGSRGGAFRADALDDVGVQVGAAPAHRSAIDGGYHRGGGARRDGRPRATACPKTMPSELDTESCMRPSRTM